MTTLVSLALWPAAAGLGQVPRPGSSAAPAWSLALATVSSGLSSGITDIDVMSTGDIVVAQAAPRRITVLHPGGEVVRQVDIAPGTAKSAPLELVIVGDSFGVHDPVAGSLDWFDQTGKTRGGRIVNPAFAHAWRSLVVHRALVSVPDSSFAACAAQLALRTSSPDLILRQVVAGGSFPSWIRAFDSGPWTAVDGEGRPIAGIAQLPAEFLPFRVLPTGIVGLLHSRTGVRLELRTVQTRAPAHAIAPCPIARGPSPESAAALRTGLFRALMAAERTHDRVGHYVSTMDSLATPTPAGSEMRILRVGQTGWVGAIFDKGSSYSCVVGTGDATPVGLIDGVINCSP